MTRSALVFHTVCEIILFLRIYHFLDRSETSSVSSDIASASMVPRLKRPTEVDGEGIRKRIKVEMNE